MKIGRYDILEPIGRGGFGQVYRAMDPAMQRTVAVKVLSSVDDPDILARFRNEAASAGNLRHKNIVTIYDFGEERGVPYIVMEYLEGRELRQVCDGAMHYSLLEKLRIMSQVAEGLLAAHQKGIIHRDVKPSNIMVLPDGSAKIMDFGIARISRGEVSRKTRTGFLIGTLEYICPEQFRGAAGDPLADIWAYGVVAFELFAGVNPFQGQDPAQTMYRVTAAPIPRMGELKTGIPPELDRIVAHLLQREPSNRYQTLEDVLLDLKPVLMAEERQEAGKLVAQARAMAGRGELEEARRMLAPVLEVDPTHAEARRLRDEIQTQLRSATQKQQIDTLLKRGEEELAAQRLDEAVAAFERAARLDPKNVTAQLRLKQAQEVLQRAAREQGALSEAVAAYNAGEPESAHRLLTDILRENPGHSEARALIGKAEEAIREKNEFTRANAMWQARVAAEEHRYEQALETLRQCQASAAGSPDVAMLIKEVQGKYDAHRAELLLSQELERAQHAVDGGRFGEALAVLDPLAARFPQRPEVAQLRADARRRMEAQAAREAQIRATTLFQPPAPAPAPAPVAPPVAAPPPMAPPVETKRESNRALPAVAAVVLVVGAAGAFLFTRDKPVSPPVAEPVVTKAVEPTPAPPPVVNPEPARVAEVEKKAEPPRVEPAKVVAKKEPPRPEPPKQQPAKQEVARQEPPPVEPVKPEPVKPEPVKQEPVRVEAPKPEPAPTYQAPSQYFGAKSGNFGWRGSLAPGATLVVGVSNVIEGGGSRSGPPLPPVDFEVQNLSAAGLRVSTGPAGAPWRVRIVNGGAEPVNGINFRWRIK